MKKVAFFLFLLVVIPTTSLAASGVTYEDCVKYMQQFRSDDEGNYELNVDDIQENMMNNTSSRTRMMNGSRSMMNGSRSMMDESSEFYQNMPCHQ